MNVVNRKGLIYATIRLNKSELKTITENYILSNHAIKRLGERCDGLCIKNAILESKLAYYNTDGSINVAIDNYRHFVFKAINDGKYLMITIKNPSMDGYTVWEKYKFAKRGFDRTPNKRNERRMRGTDYGNI